MKKHIMKKREIYLIAGILLAAISLLSIQQIFAVKGSEIRITVNGEEYGVYSLEEEQEIKIGETNVLEIQEGKARMRTAECPDQLCVGQNWIEKKGQSIICLPNQIVVTVMKGEENGLDAVAQ